MALNEALTLSDSLADGQALCGLNAAGQMQAAGSKKKGVFSFIHRRCPVARNDVEILSGFGQTSTPVIQLEPRR
jgi:hypothetical protein